MFYDHIADMEPLLPGDKTGDLTARAVSLLSEAKNLARSLRPHTRSKVASLVRSMNGYYSNLIEGHRTKPHEIESALKKDFSDSKSVREKQLLHLAHLGALETLEAMDLPVRELLKPEVVCLIHEEFCKRLPADMLVIQDTVGNTYDLVPGKLRDYNVAVGRHLAPDFKALPKLLARFSGFYAQESEKPAAAGIIAAMAAHHRLAWIHPFGDGNGRVARLMTHLWARSLGAGGDGLWTLSRGLARRVDSYRAALDAADEKRHNDFDGRGYLSDAALHNFCGFMLDTAIDQTRFMAGLFDVGNFENRLTASCRQREAEGQLHQGASLLVKQVFLEDEIRRGDAARILNVSPRTAQGVIGELVEQGWLSSPSPKGPLHLDFPNSALAFLFPELYPSGGPEDRGGAVLHVETLADGFGSPPSGETAPGKDIALK